MPRVIAHFMLEAERAAAQKLLKRAAVTGSFVLGEARKKDIKLLEEAGLVVDLVDDGPPIETPGRAALVLPGVRRPTRAPRITRDAVAPAPPPPDLSKPNVFLIQLRGPLLSEWQNTLADIGVRLLEYIPRQAYSARLSRETATAVQALSFVSSVRLYDVIDTAPPAVVRRQRTPTGKRMLTYDVLLHRPEDKEETLTWLADHRVSVAGASAAKIRVYLLEDDVIAGEIAALPAVASLEAYQPPRLHNDAARLLLGLERLGAPAPATTLGQTGRGQIVGVADTGIDRDHPDLQGRLLRTIARGRDGDASDPHGHGTHVAASIAGGGEASGGALRGVAPEAVLVMQSLLDATDGLGGLPLDLGELFSEAYESGARVHNNSWGADAQSYYTASSLEVDSFVAAHRDMLLVFSAGNAGADVEDQQTGQGFVDWLSIDAPASAKNALAVGASRSNRASGGFASLTFGDVWPDRFPHAPIAGEHVSGNAEALAAFSSRGPCDDRRIKPDVTAPGTDIASARSVRAPLRNFWGPFPGNNRYAYLGGTSMAAPLVSGCAALIRQYYVEERQHEPSAALLRATIINSTRRLSAADAVAEHDTLPNFHQGFGAVYMPWAVPNQAEPDLRLAFSDAWKDTSLRFSKTGDFVRFTISCAAWPWLRFCLAWTDAPGRALQNDLDLFIQHSISGRKWVGNASLPLKLTATDRDNNVETVRIENPADGEYLVQIAAKNMLRGPQDFALIVTGKLASPLAKTAGSV